MYIYNYIIYTYIYIYIYILSPFIPFFDHGSCVFLKTPYKVKPPSSKLVYTPHNLLTIPIKPSQSSYKSTLLSSIWVFQISPNFWWLYQLYPHVWWLYQLYPHKKNPIEITMAWCPKHRRSPASSSSARNLWRAACCRPRRSELRRIPLLRRDGLFHQNHKQQHPEA